MKETGLTGKRRSTTIAATPDDGNSQRKRRRRGGYDLCWCRLYQYTSTMIELFGVYVQLLTSKQHYTLFGGA